MLFHTGEFEKNLAVVVLEHLNVGRNHAVGVDTVAQHVGGGVVHAVLDFRLEGGGYSLAVVADLFRDNRAENHGVVGIGHQTAVLVDECAHIVGGVVAFDY